MEDTLINGDKILVNKLYHVTLNNFSLFFNCKLFCEKHFDVRKEGSKNQTCCINRNDVIVFHFPEKSTIHFIKRCIGLPGETLKIVNGQVFCNGNIIKPSVKEKSIYLIWVNNLKEFYSLIDNLNFNKFGLLKTENLRCFEAEININQLDIFNSSVCIDSISIKSFKDNNTKGIYPNNNRFLWTFENFGPVLIPKKGMKIKLTPENYILYKKAIEKYERQRFTFKNNHVYNNGKPIENYTFKQDYFFMMGDNRHKSYDSRGWGFVPEEAIIGKAEMVLFSNNDFSGFKWNRLLHIIK